MGQRSGRLWCSAAYEWLAGLQPMQRLMNPLREEVAGQASGHVLEVGAGSGRNFPYYVPERVERVEAVEPDASMLRYARQREALACVSIPLVQAPAEALPFANATFDCAVATLVFCSVFDPPRALRELLRVLKPGGCLLLVEHVRSPHWLAAHVQDLLVPLTTRLAGNCHWNRDTEHLVTESGFDIRSVRRLGTGIQPVIVLHAVRPQE
jgi:ubiquinone/menaquinone biosynthesis C-methylase UbiE